jgi:hypothetical protein
MIRRRAFSDTSLTDEIAAFLAPQQTVDAEMAEHH